MGFFSNLISAASSFFRSANTNMRSSDVNAEDSLQGAYRLLETCTDLHSRVAEDYQYADSADNSYYELIANQLQSVPAVNIYDGNYVSQLNEIDAKISGIESELQLEISRMEAEQASNANSPVPINPSFVSNRYENEIREAASELSSTATQIQTYLREDTSDIDAAKLWDAKFVKSAVEHIPPHYKKNEGYYDGIMAETMEAFRRFQETANYQIDMYGSQNLINATYEAVNQGQEAMNFIQTILDLSAESGGEEENLNENANIIVPNAGFFSGGFFF